MKIIQISSLKDQKLLSYIKSIASQIKSNPTKSAAAAAAPVAAANESIVLEFGLCDFDLKSLAELNNFIIKNRNIRKLSFNNCTFYSTVQKFGERDAVAASMKLLCQGLVKSKVEEFVLIDNDNHVPVLATEVFANHLYFNLNLSKITYHTGTRGTKILCDAIKGNRTIIEFNNPNIDNKPGKHTQEERNRVKAQYDGLQIILTNRRNELAKPILTAYFTETGSATNASVTNPNDRNNAPVGLAAAEVIASHASEGAGAGTGRSAGPGAGAGVEAAISVVAGTGGVDTNAGVAVVGGAGVSAGVNVGLDARNAPVPDSGLVIVKPSRRGRCVIL